MRGDGPRGFVDFVFEDQRVERDVSAHAAPCSVRMTSGNSASENPTFARAEKCFRPK